MVVLFLGSGLNLHAPVSPRNNSGDRKLADTSLRSRVWGPEVQGEPPGCMETAQPLQEVGSPLSQKGQHNLWS